MSTHVPSYAINACQLHLITSYTLHTYAHTPTHTHTPPRPPPPPPPPTCNTQDIGIKPPKGVILYGEPGTGKTLLAKVLANQTSASFLRVVGSELIQKYLGDG